VAGGIASIRNDVVWKFLTDGLVKLGLADPKTDKFISNEDRKDCVRWVEYAADGLPKSIIKLGRRIGDKGVGRSRVSQVDIIATAKEMVYENFRQYRNKYKTLFSLIREDDVAQQVCLWMFRRGASRIHSLEDLSADLAPEATYFMLEEAIKFLAKADLVVVTGCDENVFFAREPLLAHTIGVAMSDPAALQIHQDYFNTDSNAKQLLLRLEGNKEPHLRTRV
jgi:hypothetical protein